MTAFSMWQTLTEPSHIKRPKETDRLFRVESVSSRFSKAVIPADVADILF